MFPGSIGVLFPSNAYLCRAPCARAVEKLLKLRDNIQKEEHELKVKLRNAGARKGLSESSQNQDSAVGGGKFDCWM